MIDVDKVIDKLKNRENTFLAHNNRKFCLPFEYLIEYARDVRFQDIDLGYFIMKDGNAHPIYAIKDGDMIL